MGGRACIGVGSGVDLWRAQALPALPRRRYRVLELQSGREQTLSSAPGYRRARARASGWLQRSLPSPQAMALNPALPTPSLECLAPGFCEPAWAPAWCCHPASPSNMYSDGCSEYETGATSPLWPFSGSVEI